MDNIKKQKNPYYEYRRGWNSFRYTCFMTTIPLKMLNNTQ